MTSVIIPAHNEERVLPRLLAMLELPKSSDHLQVVVVANGCTDRTSDVARDAGADVVVIDRASKIDALNAGDEFAEEFPRFYLDADVLIDAAGLRELAEILERGDVLAVSPRLVVDASGSVLIVRSYCRYWSLLPSVQRSLAGHGCIGVSEAGRSRWGTFPDVINDDQFVNVQFDPDSIAVAEAVTSTVIAPRTLRALVRRNWRSHRGNLQLAELGHPGATSRIEWLGVVRDRPRVAVDLPAFVMVTLLVRASLKVQKRRGSVSWGTDATSRQ
jgi:glycosyltransferase involved in cell wall biosynthesis